MKKLKTLFIVTMALFLYSGLAYSSPEDDELDVTIRVMDADDDGAHDVTHDIDLPGDDDGKEHDDDDDGKGRDDDDDRDQDDDNEDHDDANKDQDDANEDHDDDHDGTGDTDDHNDGQDTGGTPGE